MVERSAIEAAPAGTGSGISPPRWVDDLAGTPRASAEAERVFRYGKVSAPITNVKTSCSVFAAMLQRCERQRVRVTAPQGAPAADDWNFDK